MLRAAELADLLGRLKRRPGVVSALAVAGLLWAGPAAAQVIELSPSGDAVTYGGPTLFTAEGAQPIVRAEEVVVSRPVDVLRTLGEAAQRQHLNVDLLHEVARQESGFRQTALSPRDAVGVMQLTAGTASDLGVDRYDLAQNVHGGAAYLRQMLDRYRGDIPLALAAYNAGPGAVDKYRGVPPYAETRAYVASILNRLAQRSLMGVAVPRLVP